MFRKAESVLKRSHALGYRHSPSYLDRSPKRSAWQQSLDDDTPVEADFSFDVADRNKG